VVEDESVERGRALHKELELEAALLDESVERGRILPKNYRLQAFHDANPA
jgi:hypothetical protein